MSARTVKRQVAARRWERAAALIMTRLAIPDSERVRIRDRHLAQASQSRKSGGSGS